MDAWQDVSGLLPYCELCGRPLRGVGASRHHLVPRSRGGAGVPANRVILCGSGTTDCHGRIEGRVGMARARLRVQLEATRPDVLAYVEESVGLSWLDRNYPPPPPSASG